MGAPPLYPKRLPTLDGWRAVAIGLVIWHHATASTYTNASLYWASDKSQWGAFGVDVFFGLSGLLITTLLLQERDLSGSISLRGFYIRRAFRILPPCLLLLAVLTVSGRVEPRLELTSCLLFFRNYFSGGSWYTGHLWSLAVEEHFYLIWPGVVVLFAGWRKDPRPVAYLSIGCALWRVVQAQTGYTSAMLAGVPAFQRTDLRADAILWGCFLAFVLRSPEKRGELQKSLRAWAGLGLALAVAACVVFFSMLASIWLAMLIPLLLASTTLHPEWSACRVLELAPVRFAGRISYSLYLWQQVFLVPGWEQRRSPFGDWRLNLLAAFACATTSYLLIEKPCMAMGRRIGAKIQSPSMGENEKPRSGDERDREAGAGSACTRTASVNTSA